MLTSVQNRHVNSAQPGNQIYCDVEIDTKPVNFQVDCGFTVCILPKCCVGNSHICPEMANLQMWNKTSLQAFGNCKRKVTNPTTKPKCKVDFVIVDKKLTPLPNGKAAQKIGLTAENYDKCKAINAVSSPKQPYIKQFLDAFKEAPAWYTSWQQGIRCS